jgi:hypothetical protein
MEFRERTFKTCAAASAVLALGIGAAACNGEKNRSQPSTEATAIPEIRPELREQINDSLGETAVSVGETVLYYAGKNGSKITKDPDKKNGFSIVFHSTDGKQLYTVFLSLEKTPEGMLDPQTTYALSVVEGPLFEERIENDAALAKTETENKSVWYGEYNKYAVEDSKKVLVHMDSLGKNAPPSLSTVRSLASRIKTMVEMAATSAPLDELPHTENEDNGADA